MQTKTYPQLRDTKNTNAKFKVGDFVEVQIGRRNYPLSRKLHSYQNQTGIVVGYRDYYSGKRNYGGNRYYVRFHDGYIGGFFPTHLRSEEIAF